MSYFNRLKDKWGVTSNRQFWIIFIVFGLTGSSSVKVARPFLDYIGLTPSAFESLPLGDAIYWFLRIVAIFPIYQVLLLGFGALFFQFTFFWEFEKKIFRRMGLKRFFPEP
ncbi:MAG: DUF6787 family protein [Flavobacteriaceae bacterium]